MDLCPEYAVGSMLKDLLLCQVPDCVMASLQALTLLVTAVPAPLVPLLHCATDAFDTSATMDAPPVPASGGAHAGGLR